MNRTIKSTFSSGNFEFGKLPESIKFLGLGFIALVNQQRLETFFSIKTSEIL